MIQLHFDVNQLNIDKSMSVLHLFPWNYVNYANMEGFRRDSHILQPKRSCLLSKIFEYLRF